MLGRFLRNIASLTAAEVFIRSLSFITFAYLARRLTLEGFGMVSFAQAILSYLLLLSQCGLPTLGTREVAKENKLSDYYVAHVLGLRFLLSCSLLAILILGVLYSTDDPTLKWLIIFYAASAIITAFFLDWFFVGLQEMHYVGLFQIIKTIVYSTAIFTMVNGNDQILYVPIAFFAANLVAAGFLLLVFTRRLQHKFKLAFNIAVWSEFLRASLPMGLALLMTQVYYNFDTIFLKAYHGNRVVAWYAAPYKIVILLNQMSVLYGSAVFPLFVKLSIESKPRLERLMRNSVRLLASLSIPIGFGGVLCAEQLVTMIFGDAFAESVILFQVLIWVFVINALSVAFGQGLLAANRQKDYLIAVSIGMVTNIALNFILIPSLAGIGAAVATVIANGAVLIAVFIRYQRIQQVAVLPHLFRPLIAALVMSSALIVGADLNIGLLLLVGGAAYFIVLLVTHGLTCEEIMGLRRELLARAVQ